MKQPINEIKRMQQLAGIITESEYQESTTGEGSDTIIPKSLVTRYANMKSLFGDKAKDPSVISKLIPIITDFFPKNLNVSYQELVDEFDEETANQVQTVLFGAYLDGYLDRFQEPITRLNHERDAKYSDYMGERNKGEYQEAVMNNDQVDIVNFLKNNKQEFLSKMADKMFWEESDMKKYQKLDIKAGADETANLDKSYSFSFNRNKVMSGGEYNFILKNINGKNVYGVSHNVSDYQKDTDDLPRDKFGRLKYF